MTETMLLLQHSNVWCHRIAIIQRASVFICLLRCLFLIFSWILF